jgi:hypothetical protein
MARQKQGVADAGSQVVEVQRQARSGVDADRGIHTAKDFAGLMSALMSDILNNRVSPTVANAAVNAGGKLLKVVEMQHKYGGFSKTQEKSLSLLG